MKEKLSIIIAVLLAGFHLTASVALATIIKVEKGGGGNYTTIQAAINAAMPGDTIKVGIGVYYENIVINKSVELIGAGATSWIPQPPATGISVIRPDEILISKYPLKPILPDPPPEIIPIFKEIAPYTETISYGQIRSRDALELLIPASTISTLSTASTLTTAGLSLATASVNLQPVSKDITYPGPTTGTTIKIPSYGTIYKGPQIFIPGTIPALPNGSIIYGNGSGHVVTFNNASTCQISGFTITNGGSEHAGIVLYSSSDVTIDNNRISKNKDGIVTSESSGVIRNNIFNENGYSANSYCDYGICCLSSILSINNNLVINQEVGIYVAWEKSGGTSVINNTITGNQYDGVWCYKASPTIKNNIITQNGYGICAIYSAAPLISYNDVWGNGQNYNQQTEGKSAPGLGDISADPVFANAGQSDYHLGNGSPCIDMGDPKPVYNDQDGTRNDMGAYGGFGGIPGGVLGSGSGFVFTDIGNIPTAEIPQDQANASFGLAKVSSSAAAKLKIQQWTDSPFGGQLRFFGQFGQGDSVDYYQILIAPWKNNDNTAPGNSDFVPLNDSLSKVRYILDGTKVTYEIVSLGPKVIGSMSNLYELNKGDYWSQPSLRMIWDSTAWPNGKYTLKYRAFRWDGRTLIEVTPGSRDSLAISATDLDHLTIIVNNSQVQTQIHWVKYDHGNPEYDPASDGNVPECAVIHLNDIRENLRFVITASHPEGYLDYFSLDCLWGKNKAGGVIHYENYATATPSSPHIWYGVAQQEFSLPSDWDQWHNCAYQFRLLARSRATDGYTYLYGSEFNDHYTIQIGDSGCASSSGIPGDINHDGRVTIDELTRVINAFLGR